MALSNFLLAWLLTAFVFSLNELAHGSHDHRQPYERFHTGRLQLGKPQEVVRSDGGSIHSWRLEDILQCTQVDISETILRENGLVIPKYIDAPSLAYIMQGSGTVGISYPYQGEFQQKYYMRRVRAGDVVAVPQGVVVWLYNDGKEEQRVMCVAETSMATNPGVAVKPFPLSGAKKRDLGGLWHGFSEDTVAEALGVDEMTARKLLTSQKDVVITRTHRKIHIPLPEHRRHHENDVGAEFTFSTQSSKADLMVENGGWLSMVTRNKLPVLANVGLSAVRVNLEPEAMVAPLWSSNAHQIIRVLRGKGRIEVATNDGDQLLHADLKKNDMFVVPRFFPSTIIAGEDGLDLIKILTSDHPVRSYFAGANSVYKGIPPQVVAEAFGIDLEMELDIRRQRTRHEVILPPSQGGTHRKHHRKEEDGSSEHPTKKSVHHHKEEDGSSKHPSKKSATNIALHLWK